MGGALMNQRLRLLRKLFLSTLYLSAFTFGGGYVIITLMKQKFVDHYHWIEEEEMLDLVAIAQSTPGAIAIDSATFVGMKIAGVPGALVATLGCILPACILVTVLAKLYLRYRNLSVPQSVLHSLRPAVVALIAAAGVSILLTAFWGTGAAVTLDGTSWVLVVLFALCVVLLKRFRWNPILVMVLAGVLNLAAGLLGF